MAKPGGDGNDLSKLSVPELERTYIESVRAAEATGHIGKKNRLARQQSKIMQELKARGEDRSVFQRLAGHSDENVSRWAASYLDWLDEPHPEAASRQPLRPEILWQCDNPPPAALTRDQIADRLRRGMPEFSGRLMDLALPAVGLWPQRRADIAATASRFGGWPLADPDWRWPSFEDEPLLFVGQINCAEFHGLPGTELLPPSGLLVFFGDYDALNGCEPFGPTGLHFWPDVDRLAAAKARIDPLEVLPSCALVPRPIIDFPHPDSHAVGKLKFNQQQRSSYFDAWLEVRDHGIPPACANYVGFSKLFGWPHQVQSDLWAFQSDDSARLLLQVDHYCNGEDRHYWGPGGSLYYLLSERDLRADRYEACEFEGQFT